MQKINHQENEGVSISLFFLFSFLTRPIATSKVALMLRIVGTAPSSLMKAIQLTCAWNFGELGDTIPK